MASIKVAFVGAGYMAGEHIKAFADAVDVELSGIFSRTSARAQALAAKYPIQAVFESIEAMYAAKSPDIVVVAVPELAVAEICASIFNYPWICLIEKPAGYNAAEAEHIAQAAKSKGRRAFVGLNRRHYSSTRAVLAELENSTEPRLVHVFDQENPQLALDSGQPAEVVANWMYANSIHIIDYFPLFCRGEVESVEHIIKWQPKNPQFVVAKINFSSGDVGIYEAVWNAPGPWAVTVTTQAKRWEMRPLEQASTQIYKSRKSEPMEIHPRDSHFKPGLRLQADEILRAFRGEPAYLPTLDDGLATMRLVSRIYAA